MLVDYLKTFPQFIMPKQILTRFGGLLANIQTPAVKNGLINYFIRKYGVDMREAGDENPANYACFNDFFIRRLKPECRPLAKADIVSPVDGIISELGHVKKGQILQAKGHYYTVTELLACEAALSEHYSNGCFATLYLSPKDYHRVHMPIDAELTRLVYVPGKLFSVQPMTARTVPRLFARNERLVAFFNTGAGLMAMVLVGATVVGAIGTRWQGDIRRSNKKEDLDLQSLSQTDLKVQQGEEMGYFKLGSTVILLFAGASRVQWLEGLTRNSRIRYGEAIGLFP